MIFGSGLLCTALYGIGHGAGVVHKHVDCTDTRDAANLLDSSLNATSSGIVDALGNGMLLYKAKFIYPYIWRSSSDLNRLITAFQPVMPCCVLA